MCFSQKEESAGSTPASCTNKNVPYPTTLPVGSDVHYRKRLCMVIVRQGELYMIKDKKNGQCTWVRPDHVEIASLV